MHRLNYEQLLERNDKLRAESDSQLDRFDAELRATSAELTRLRELERRVRDDGLAARVADDASMPSELVFVRLVTIKDYRRALLQGIDEEVKDGE